MQKELIRKNFLVEQPRNQVSEMHFDKFPIPSTFQCWKTSFKTEVCSCSGYSEAMHWIKEAEMVESVNDLESSQSIRDTVTTSMQIQESIGNILGRPVGNSVIGSPPNSEGKQLGQARLDAQYCSRPVFFCFSKFRG